MMAKPVGDEGARNPYWHDHDRGEQECPACIWAQRLADGLTPLLSAIPRHTPLSAAVLKAKALASYARPAQGQKQKVEKSNPRERANPLQREVK
jgi:hypothetical protein